MLRGSLTFGGTASAGRYVILRGGRRTLTHCGISRASPALRRTRTTGGKTTFERIQPRGQGGEIAASTARIARRN